MLVLLVVAAKILAVKVGTSIDWPICLASQPALSACLPCQPTGFVLCLPLPLVLLKWIFCKLIGILNLDIYANNFQTLNAYFKHMQYSVSLPIKDTNIDNKRMCW
jgi:hypothetical protein